MSLKFTKALSLMLAVLTLVCVMPINGVAKAATSWPSLSSASYCEFKPLIDINVYIDTDCTVRGSNGVAYNACIEAGDVCRMYGIYSNYISIAYPVSGNYKTGYIKRSSLFGTTTAPTGVCNSADCSSGVANVYRNASTAYSRYGYIESGDKVYACGQDGSFTRVIYSAKSGSRAYKFGYVKTSDYNRIAKTQSSSGSGCSCSTSYAGTYTTKNVSSSLTIRADHSSSSAAIGYIPAGATFSVSKGNGTWAHVTYNGISGYASMSYMQKPSTTTGCSCSTSYSGYYTGKTQNTSSIKLYASHDKSSSVLCTIPADTILYVSKGNSTWAHVTYNDKSGYVEMSFLQKGEKYTASGNSIFDVSNVTTYNGKSVQYRIVTIDPVNTSSKLYKSADYDKTLRNESKAANKKNLVSFLGNGTLFVAQFAGKTVGKYAGAISTVFDFCSLASQFYNGAIGANTIVQTNNVAASANMASNKRVRFVWIKWNNSWVLAQRSEQISVDLETTMPFILNNASTNYVSQIERLSSQMKYTQGNLNYHLFDCIKRVADNYWAYRSLDSATHSAIVNKSNYPIPYIKAKFFDEDISLSLDNVASNGYMTNYGAKDFTDNLTIIGYSPSGVLYEF